MIMRQIPPPLTRAWFLLSNGALDTIDLAVAGVVSAEHIARQLDAPFWFRCVSWDHSMQVAAWECYRTAPLMTVHENVKPIKVLQSPDISAAEMFCRMKGAKI